ncbi:hypothetical protein VMCG_09047 [Cytospora schulzeri]|uniref:Transcriptional coactivator p15 (PC4) C-terminal domain-containing protein n=1 Tax=Cytospora schulzeri TaxID=448051 RepID=A0A423VP51_9PEZI|nr:hypothetical protein VMCG_09047 [Valsa malicola]
MVKGRLKRSSSFVASDNSGGEEPPAKVTKKPKKSSSSSDSKNVDDEGNTFWDLSNKRRIVVQKFKGNVYVNLREYYEDKKTGAMKPGMKGLMLSVEQYQTLLSTVPAINKELRNNGVKIGDEDAESNAGEEAADEEAAEEDDGSESDKKPTKSTKVKKETAENSTGKKLKGKKANIEATSDEDDSE